MAQKYQHEYRFDPRVAISSYAQLVCIYFNRDSIKASGVCKIVIGANEETSVNFSAIVVQYYTGKTIDVLITTHILHEAVAKLCDAIHGALNDCWEELRLPALSLAH